MNYEEIESNPFEHLGASWSYADFIDSQVCDLDVGQSIKADLNGVSVDKFRATLRYVGEKYGKKFKTKRDNKGRIWVRRVGAAK